FRLDLLDRLAAFEDQVDVLRLAANGPSDSLSCQLLRVHFLMRARAAAAAAGAATSTNGSNDSPSGGINGASPLSNSDGPGSGSSSIGLGGAAGGLGGSGSSSSSSGPSNSGGSGPNSSSSNGAASGDKTSANSSTNALRKFEVERIVATGHPVVLRAPSAGAAARGERLEYNVRTRLLHLEDSQKASLTRDNQELQSPHIQYELPVDTRRLGRAWAAGPGSMTRTNPATGAIAVSARWGQELLLRPHQDRHVLSISGGTSIQLGALGQFAADELHVWILEATDDKKVAIEFDRLLAQGNVNFGSPRMDGKTQRLEAWFRREPAELTAPGTGPGSTASYSSGLPGVPVSASAGGALGGAFTSASAGGAGANRSPVNKLEVRGDLVRVQASLIGDSARLDEISVRGRVEVNEQTPPGTTPAPGADPLKIVGDSLEVHDAQSEQSVLQVVGRPARVSARGMVLQGDSVNLDQNEGRMWIEGVGQMTLPALALRSKPKGEVLFQNNTPLAPAAPLGIRADELDPQARQETTTKPTPVIVSWKGGMEFDGLNAKFQRDVQIRGAHRLSTGEVYDLMAVGGQLDITLTRRVRFDGPSPTDDVEMQNVRFSGHVYAEGRTTQAGGMVSQEKLQIRNLSLDHSTGRIQGDGPGWVESVRLDQSPAGSPLGGRAPAGPGPHLAFLHIDFARGIQGHLPTNTIEALDDVRAVYGPVSAWDQTIDSQQPDLLGDSSIVLTCQRVAISQPPSAPTVAGQPAIELEATGNALVEGRRFAARAARISFSQAKDLLIFAGDGRTDAEFWKKPRGGKLKPDAIARTIFYNRQTGDVEIDKGKYFDLAPFTDGLQQQQQQQRRPPGR
ncbi:MAG TPA: hypothetical protein PLV92_06905, partial [Pirellulaceae bacterium]|nr:hypothetical protein [Pirellulaceae bacterium]